jgi:hypothetical protein
VRAVLIRMLSVATLALAAVVSAAPAGALSVLAGGAEWA